MKLLASLLILLSGINLYGQKSFDDLYKNKSFTWLADSSSEQITIYYQATSWTASNIENVKQRMISHVDLVKSFINIQSYPSRILLFIVDSREEMEQLVGWKTNGSAFYHGNIITGIASSKNRTIYSNHELFHVMAMNTWGVPETWINEGMAVYSDNQWHGHDLHQLTKYLLDQNRYVPLNTLIKKFRTADDLVSYPLIGSFTKFMDETYGREIIIRIWKGKSRKIKSVTGKKITELEQEWLSKIKTVQYDDIKY